MTPRSGAGYRRVGAPEAALPTPTVLVVDDDPEVLDATATLLESEGYQVVVAREGADALAKLQTAPLPALVLLDLMMPGMSGFELYGRLRALAGPAGRLPVIVVSAARDARRHARELGAEGCLPKPYQLDDLLAQVASFAGKPVL